MYMEKSSAAPAGLEAGALEKQGGTTTTIVPDVIYSRRGFFVVPELFRDFDTGKNNDRTAAERSIHGKADFASV